MKILQQVLILTLSGTLLLSSLPAANAAGWLGRGLSEDGDEGGSGDGSGSGDEDDDAFFQFDDYTKWDGYSIVPEACITLNNEDLIVFSLHGNGNKQCSKKKKGTYSASVDYFMRGYSRQMKDTYELKGYDYDKPEALNYLDCTYEQINDNDVYVKLGCSASSGRGIALKSYSDAYCTQSSNYNTNQLGIDLSGLKVQFGTCTDCVYWPSTNNNGDDDGAGYDDNFDEYHAYDSPLCATANYYKSSCGGKCKKLASAQHQTAGRRGFSAFGKFMLFVFSLIGIFSLLAVRGQRMKMSREQALIEEAAVRKAGLQMKNIGLIIILVVILIIICMIAKLKALTWILLITTDAVLIGYWLFLHFRSTGKTEIGGFKLFGSSQGEVA